MGAFTANAKKKPTNSQRPVFVAISMPTRSETRKLGCPAAALTA